MRSPWFQERRGRGGALDGLGLGSHRTSDQTADATAVSDNSKLERTALFIAFVPNAAMFFGEAIAGWLANSLGLLADALDMGARRILKIAPRN